MRALVCRELGDPTRPPRDGGALAVEDRPRLFPEGVPPRGVRVKVAFAALNFADLLMARGEYQEKPALPFVPGGEFSGVVAESGAEARAAGFAPGAKVAGVLVGGGAMAEEVVVRDALGPPSAADGAVLFPAPPALSLAAAAAFPVCHGTAHLALCERARVAPNERVLVLGAAGGVGLAAVQIAKARGALVVACAKGDAKRVACADAGADAVVDVAKLPGEYGGTPFRDAVFEAFEALESSKRRSNRSGGGVSKVSKVSKGADVVFDPVGGDAFASAIKCARWGARVLVVGFASGRIPRLPLNLALVKNLTVHGVYWGAHAVRDPGTLARSTAEALGMAARGIATPRVDARTPLERAWEAFAALERREVVGKVVIAMGEDIESTTPTADPGGRGAGRSRL